ncbi:MAG: S53 family peptidase [Thermoplasmata archaeon]
MLRHATIGLVVFVMVTFGFVAAVSGTVAVGAVSGAVVSTDLQSVYFAASPAQLPTNGNCGSGLSLLHCFSPQDIQSAYNYGPAYNAVGGYANAGEGQTIVIFDAFGDPAVRADLKVFDHEFGLPAAHLNIICPAGCPKLDETGDTPLSDDEIGWGQEISLDTQYSHAMAPAATIDLVISWNDSNNDIAFAEQYALNHHLGNIWSQSFGSPECTFAPGPGQPWFAENNRIYQKAAAEGITIYASAGDDGAQFGCANPSSSYPADNPYNIAVTGSYLNLTFAAGATVGKYSYETTWDDFENPLLISEGQAFGVTGGAPSHYFAKPWWQDDHAIVPYSCTGSTEASCTTSPSTWHIGKVDADVSYDAGVNGGVFGYMSFSPAIPTGFYIFGGTSAGSPQWAAITAILDQLNGGALGNIAPLLYQLGGTGAFHDIHEGSNALYPGVGYASEWGWDAASGMGTPNVGGLIHYV